MFLPKIFTTLKDYSKEQFFHDLTAGLVVGIVALPLAIAFGIASGVSPEKGLITAIVAGFMVSMLGGSRVQIGGPTGAFVLIVYGVVQKYGVDNLVIATLLAGIILMVMGIARLGTVIKYIPRTVIVGFTSGIALIIFSSQIKDFFGLSIGSMPADFISKWSVIFLSLDTVSGNAVFIGVATILVILACQKVSRRIPGSLVAILLMSVIAAFFHLSVETIGTRFGELPNHLPMPHFPVATFPVIRSLLQPALAIALLGAIESLLSAAVADRMIGGNHRSNMELVAQGCANVASALFGGIPATGAIARTVTNVKNGGRTPVAGVIHSIVLLLILLFFGPWIKLIPLSCLAGILVLIAYHMSEWHPFLEIFRNSKKEAAVLAAVFLITVLVDLTAAIALGVVLSFLMQPKRISSSGLRNKPEGK